jgi:hypothetical protein
LASRTPIENSHHGVRWQYIIYTNCSYTTNHMVKLIGRESDKICGINFSLSLKLVPSVGALNQIPSRDANYYAVHRTATRRRGPGRLARRGWCASWHRVPPCFLGSRGDNILAGTAHDEIYYICWLNILFTYQVCLFNVLIIDYNFLYEFARAIFLIVQILNMIVIDSTILWKKCYIQGLVSQNNFLLTQHFITYMCWPRGLYLKGEV